MGVGTSTRRSTTRTAARPEAAARDCSQARCRQDDEHHFGSRPVALTAIGPPHHPHVRAAARRGDVSVTSCGIGAEPMSAGGPSARRRSRATRRRLRPVCALAAFAHAADGPDGCSAPCHPDPSRRIDGGRCMRCVGSRPSSDGRADELVSVVIVAVCPRRWPFPGVGAPDPSQSAWAADPAVTRQVCDDSSRQVTPSPKAPARHDHSTPLHTVAAASGVGDEEQTQAPSSDRPG